MSYISSPVLHYQQRLHLTSEQASNCINPTHFCTEKPCECENGCLAGWLEPEKRERKKRIKKERFSEDEICVLLYKDTVQSKGAWPENSLSML